MVRLLNRRVTGQQIIETSEGWLVRPKPRGRTAKLVNVIGVLEDRLSVIEVRLTGFTAHEQIGSAFDAAPWPGQLLDDYNGKDEIVMRAEKFNGFWVVQMTGDRQYTDFPADLCDPCEPNA